MEETTPLVLELEGPIDSGLADCISEAMNVETRTLVKHGLDGDVASWLLVGNFVISALAALGPILSQYLAGRRVKSIRIGDVSIENPRSEDVSRILRDWAGSRDGISR